MAGQVGLYSDDSNTHSRPDSSRPQAARSRVDTRGAERKPHSGRGSKCQRALPASLDSLHAAAGECFLSPRLAFGLRLSLRFWRRHCVRFASVLAVLLSRFAFGLRLPSRFFCRVLPSVHACPHSSVAAFGIRFTPAVCLATNRTACDSLRSYSAGSRSPFVRSRGALRLSALAETRSWSARRCGSVAAFGVRFASVLAVLSRCFAFVHACCLSRDKQDGLR